jgi:multiple sugar transport system substrate-binding protein
MPAWQAGRTGGRARSPRLLAWGQAVALGCALFACGAPAGPNRITLWVHSGPGPERDVYRASIREFNESQNEVQVDLTELPEGSYNDQIYAAALARQLPGVLEFDGPYVTTYAWAKRIIPIDAFPAIRAISRDMLPTLVSQGSFNHRLYTVGQYDSGLAIWGNRKLLAKAGVRLPAGVAEPWTLSEFEAALEKLRRSGVDHPLDLKFNYGAGEWFTYGFAPILQSFGGDLIDRKDFRTSRGFINGPAAVKAMTLLQSWVKAGYVNASTRDDGDFIKGRSALSYVGHWTYASYRAALGQDLVLIPMPNFGGRVVTGAGSWNFGISADCPNPQAAAKLLAHLMSSREIARVTEANGAIPGTFTALKASGNYGEGGALALYREQLSLNEAVVRPATPAYPAISLAFAEAVNDIIAGADVKTELDQASRRIDQEIEDNRGYPVK